MQCRGLLISLYVTLLVVQVYGYSGGSGTPEDPYQISWYGDLYRLNKTVEDFDNHFILTSDIDLDPNLPGHRVFDQAVIAQYPITTQSKQFSGSFDGNGHAIRNLHISVTKGTKSPSFFARLDPGARVVNLELKNVFIKTDTGYNYNHIGCLTSENYGTVSDCHISGVIVCHERSKRIGGLVGINRGDIDASSFAGHISGGEYVGGLVGSSIGHITNCFCSGSVVGEEYVGGLVGLTSDSVSGSSSNATVTGDKRVGGLVGGHSRGSLSDCYSTGAVEGRYHTGGLVGYHSATITRCYTKCDVNGLSETGGLVGRNYSYGKVYSSHSSGNVSGGVYVGGLVGGNFGRVMSCYSNSTVTGHSHMGGLVGRNADWSIPNQEDSYICSCYSTGPVVRQSLKSFVGGLVGQNEEGQVVRCCWDIESSGYVRSDGGAGLTQSEMMSMKWSSLQGFGEDPNWIIEPNKGYPRLNWEDVEGQPISSPVVDWLVGGGSESDPYELRTQTQFIGLSKSSWLWDKHFYLAQDVNLLSVQLSQAVFPGFSGCFNGGGNSIFNFSVVGASHVGFFGHLYGSAVVRDLKLLNIDVNTTGQLSNAGGLVGRNEGCILDCMCSGRLIGAGYAGGLVGRNDGYIVNSSTHVAVEGVDVYPSSKSTGGLTGINYGCILSCFNEGSVFAQDIAGGLIGINYGLVGHAYSGGAVQGNKVVGGFAGKNEGGVSCCYSTGAVSGGSEVGGLVGQGDPNFVSRSYWDTDTSGMNISQGGIGISSLRMQDIQTFYNAGWDMLGESENGTSDYWCISPEEGYPILSFRENVQGQALEGAGKFDTPYLITSIQDLGVIWRDPTAYYRLENDIDLSAVIWPMAVVPWFRGVIDGNGHVIKNLHIDSGGYLGLFGKLEKDSLVSNLGLMDVMISGIGETIGGFSGWLRAGVIRNCFCTGFVRGSKNIGGLVGKQIYLGRIRNSYTQCTVQGVRYVGGLVGNLTSDTEIDSCYSAGPVRGQEDTSGLVGRGFWAEVNNCFWDVDATGQSTGIFGKGLSTQRMWKVYTYTNAGWDFQGESRNGIHDDWQMPEGGGYPILSVFNRR